MKRFDIYLVVLNPTLGSEIKKTRPCVIISPDEMNDYINTIIIAPMTSTTKSYPTRVDCVFQEKKGQIVLDQIRTVEKIRLIKKIGVLDSTHQEQVLSTLAEMFAL
ncbi:death on curing protein [Geminocystis sp. NIES-3708]|uniref:type II toxin-antitoxin system PemK/MazF family toxin n=1 Tax=Geminocystis sp. NIES-3708 TaxID=1615909 RepID=UPI0005FC9DEC|nr:type II toxin-antitoxin system PemK/MazF family toxin [Geminocystis sp. NIES-3708]BAQ61063.1 death on curing protein [Geminocystis sp. NIES-3708]